MDKSEKIRLIYSVVIAVFVIAIGIALICVAADIYYSGRGTGVIFTREIVVNKLRAFVIPFIILIGGIVAGAIFPLYEVRASRRDEDVLKVLENLLPSGGSGEQYEQAERDYKSVKRARLYVFIGKTVALLGLMIAALCYVLDTSHFVNNDITREIFAMVKHVLPLVVGAFALLIGCGIADGIMASKQLSFLKTLVKYGNRTPAEPATNKFTKSAKAVLSSDITLWVVRAVVLVVGVTFLILGIFNGGAHDVLVKAINICTECIGLG